MMSRLLQGCGFLFLTLALTACSKKEDTLAHCVKRDFHFTVQGLMLTGAHRSQPHLYLFHNISAQPLVVNHLVKSIGASAGWAQSLKPNDYAAFVSGQPNFAWTCLAAPEGAPRHFVACSKVMSVCQLEDYRWDGLSRDGNSFWAADSQPLSALQKTLREKGVRYLKKKISSASGRDKLSGGSQGGL